jgi:hypothetical protein
MEAVGSFKTLVSIYQIMEAVGSFKTLVTIYHISVTAQRTVTYILITLIA